MRVAIAIVVLVGCRREPAPSAIKSDPVVVVDAAHAVEPKTLFSVYGENAELLEKYEIEDLDPKLLPSEQRASGKRPVRIGWAALEYQQGRSIVVLGPNLGWNHQHEPLYAQAFAPSTMLEGKGPAALWKALWYSPPAYLLVLTAADTKPVAARFVGPVLRARTVELFAAPTFFVERLGNESGIDDPIHLMVVTLRSGELRVVAQYDLGPHSSQVACTSPKVKGCVLEAPGSVEIVSTKPPTLRARFAAFGECKTPAEAMAGCRGAEIVDVWDEAMERFVSGPPKPITLASKPGVTFE